MGGNWVYHGYLVRFAYNNSYHMNLNIVMYKVLCDYQTNYLGNG